MRTLSGGREDLDHGGKHGVQGHCIASLRDRWLAHPYLNRRPPKSVPRQSFVDEFIHEAVQAARQPAHSIHDVLCTSSHFVAQMIARAVERHIPKSAAACPILLSGGGVRNGLLWHLLAQQFPNRLLEKTDSRGVPAEARKAMGFGILASLTIDGVAANLPNVTGAAGGRLLGSLTPGSTSNWARCLSWMAAQSPSFESDDD
jgi:anhydro-N-acetylmuramic acid kinase